MSKVKIKKMTNKHLDMITTIMSETIGDYQRHGYSHSDINPILKKSLEEYCAEEKLTLTLADYKQIAITLKSQIQNSEGWTLEDIRFLKSFFKGHGVSKFEVT